MSDEVTFEIDTEKLDKSRLTKIILEFFVDHSVIFFLEWDDRNRANDLYLHQTLGLQLSLVCPMGMKLQKIHHKNP